jgi:uncharacterized membrane protein YfcA
MATTVIELSLFHYTVCAGLGLVAGFFAGLLGIGGGAILVPVFGAVFIAAGLSPEQALPLSLGTAMLTIVATSSLSAFGHWRTGQVLRRELLWLMPCMALGALLATRIIVHVPVSLLAGTFCLFLLYTCYKLWRSSAQKRGQNKDCPAFLLCLGGLGIGALSSLLAIGGGSLSVPFLHYLGKPIKAAIASSAVLGLAIALSGSFGFLFLQEAIWIEGAIGLVYWRVSLVTAVACMLFVPLGVRCAHVWPAQRLKKIFALLLLAVCGKMLTNYFF